MTAIEFRDAVDALMKPVYGLTWKESFGDLDYLERAIAAHQTPAEFVESWVAKQRLKPIDDPTFFDCDDCGKDCGEIFYDARHGRFLCEDCAPDSVKLSRV